MRVLITGGAGFIGTHLTRLLLREGWQVTLLDNFHPQIHPHGRQLDSDIESHVEVIEGDVADVQVLANALGDAEFVVHLAAETGTGQSMYEVCRYEHTNMGGSAALYEVLATSRNHKVERIVVASSRAIYGEGAYECAGHGVVYPISRSTQEKSRGIFDPACPHCGGVCKTIPTPETAPMQPSSFYGLTKQMQEQCAMLFGAVLDIPTFGLRYQNVYGPGQSLSNPYTGILAIYSNLARMGKKMQVFEDGAESRDFVYVEDVARATATCLTVDAKGSHSINVGSNQRTSVHELAGLVNNFYGGQSEIEITGAFRDGDIRHGMADLRMARELLGYEPQWKFRDGLYRFLEWAGASEPDAKRYEHSLVEMGEKGLLHGRS